MLLRTMLVTALLVASPLAYAGEPIVLAGAGTLAKCGDWSANRARTDTVSTFKTNSVIAWLQAYLSGINAERYYQKGRPQFGLPNADVLRGMLDQYCQKDPLLEVWLASDSIAAELTKRSAIPEK